MTTVPSSFKEHAVEIVIEREGREERIPATATAQGLRLADGELIDGMAAFKVRFPGATIDHRPNERPAPFVVGGHTLIGR